MNKLIIISFIALTTLGCQNNSKLDLLNAEIRNLKKQNDSLIRLTEGIKNKYVFDSVTIRQIPHYSNSNKLKSTFIEEFVFVGYNSDGRSSVIIGDSISYDDGMRVVQGDTLKLKKGGFIHEFTLNQQRTYYGGILKSENDFGKKYEAPFRSGVATKN